MLQILNNVIFQEQIKYKVRELDGGRNYNTIRPYLALRVK